MRSLKQKETLNKNLLDLTSEIEKLKKENPKTVVKRKEIEQKSRRA